MHLLIIVYIIYPFSSNVNWQKSIKYFLRFFVLSLKWDQTIHSNNTIKWKIYFIQWFWFTSCSDVLLVLQNETRKLMANESSDSTFKVSRFRFKPTSVKDLSTYFKKIYHHIIYELLKPILNNTHIILIHIFFYFVSWQWFHVVIYDLLICNNFVKLTSFLAEKYYH